MFFSPQSVSGAQLGFPGGGFSPTVHRGVLNRNFVPQRGGAFRSGGAFLSGGSLKQDFDNFFSPLTHALTPTHHDPRAKQQAIDILRGKSAMQSLMQGTPLDNVMTKLAWKQAHPTGGAFVPGHVHNWLRSRRQQGLPPVWHPSGHLVRPGEGPPQGPVGGRFMLDDEDTDDDTDAPGRTTILDAALELGRQTQRSKELKESVVKSSTLGAAGVDFMDSALGLADTALHMGAKDAAYKSVDTVAKGAVLAARGLGVYEKLKKETDKLGWTTSVAETHRQTLNQEAEERRLTRREEGIEDERRRAKDRKDVQLALALMRSNQQARRTKRLRTTGLAVRRNRRGQRAVIIP